MIVGKNWKSGSDETSLQNFKTESHAINLDFYHKYRFNKDGLLTDQNIVAKDRSSVPKIAFIVEHGYVYLASKEMFLYSDKNIEIVTPEYAFSLPDYIEIALGGPYGVVGSGIIGSGIMYSSGIFSIYDIAEIPKWMSPMILDDYPFDSNGPIVRTKRRLNEISRSELTILPDRNTGLEEPISEIYETKTIRNINKSKHNIITPDKYIYDPLTAKLYAKGKFPKLAIEFENSNTTDTQLGEDFAASLLGKNSGSLAITTSNDVTSSIRLSRRDVNIRGSHIFIRQGISEILLVTIGTEYVDNSGNVLKYHTLENNDTHAILAFHGHVSSNIYINELLVGRTDSSGIGIVPILGTANNGIHGRIIITGSSRVKINTVLNSPFTGKLTIEIKDSITGELINSENLIVNPTNITVSAGAYTSNILFINKNTSSVKIKNLVLANNIYIQELHQSWIKTLIKFNISQDDIFLDSSGEGVIVQITPKNTAQYLIYNTYPFTIIPSTGGINYGI